LHSVRAIIAVMIEWADLLCTITYRHTPTTEFLFSYRYSCIGVIHLSLSVEFHECIFVYALLIKRNSYCIIMALSCIV